MTSSLPEGFTSRPPRPDEIETVFEFIHDCELAEEGYSDKNLSDLQSKWNSEKFNLATDALLVLDPSGKIAGYACGTELHQPNLGGSAYVGPAYTGKGIGSFLVDWLDERMNRQIPEIAPEMEINFINWISSKNDDARQILEKRGYNQTREFWQMQFLMDEPPAAPAWPEGITVRTMVPGQDDRLFYDLYEEIFSDHWGHVQHPYENFARNVYEKKTFDPSLLFLAVDRGTGEMAGYSICSNEDGVGWIGYLGVRRPYRRLGLGLAILQNSFYELYNRSLKEVRLVVDGQSLTGATRLYTGAGMKPIMRFARFEKTVRPGISLGVKELAE
ncbi:MAG: GNAT family N-acetyltransferase [Chloroflexi bacterium]|nr:GNAT family N-acetyltransferase [Chloroflexota bacterium]OJW02656.1 MAG: hypothetical protein BGO39_33120 [Chloroflexi bacterium 54-19]